MMCIDEHIQTGIDTIKWNIYERPEDSENSVWMLSPTETHYNGLLFVDLQ